MRGWLPALRIARREARRSKGRSSLVMVMIGLPVMFLAFVAVTYDMFTLSDIEQVERRMGAADALLTWNDTAEVTQSLDATSGSQIGESTDGPTGQRQLEQLLPQGTRVLQLSRTQVNVRTPNGIGTAEGRVGDLSDPLMRGMAFVVDGAAPSQSDQVALTAAAAKWLNVDIGGTIKTVDVDRSFVVAAIVEYRDDLDSLVVFHPSATDIVSLGGEVTWLADTPAPVDWAMVRQLNKHGVLVASRSLILNPPPLHELPGVFYVDADLQVEELALGGIAAGVAVLEIVLLAGPAFAVGARRRVRDLALVAAVGGAPKQLRHIVLADGVVLGLAGGIVGVAAGVALAIVSRPLIEEHVVIARAGGYRFFPLALLGIALLAVGTALLAAAIPAFIAARQDIVRSLTGRRGIVKSRKRWIVTGLGMTAAAAVTAVFGAINLDEMLILAGVILGEFGLVLVTPALIGLMARLGRWLPLAPRLALRDTARSRSSAAPAVSAVMAAVAAAVALGTYLGAQERQYNENYTPNLPLGHMSLHPYGTQRADSPDWTAVEGAVRSVFPDADAHVYQSTACSTDTDDHCWLTPVIPMEHRCPYFGRTPTAEEIRATAGDDRCRPEGPVVVDDGKSLAAFTDSPEPDLVKAREVLARGGVVVTDRRLIKDGKVMLEVHSGEEPEKTNSLPTIEAEAYLLGSGVPGFSAMLSPNAVARAQLATVPRGVVVGLERQPDAAALERLRARLQAPGSEMDIQVERGPESENNLISIVLALAAAAIALGAAGIVTGLMAADSRADLSTLATVGAAPRVRRRLSLSQAGIVAGLGGLLGALTGIGSGAVLILAKNAADARGLGISGAPLRFGIAWDSIAIIVAVPLVAMAFVGLLTRSRLPIERRL